MKILKSISWIKRVETVSYLASNKKCVQLEDEIMSQMEQKDKIISRTEKL